MKMIDFLLNILADIVGEKLELSKGRRPLLVILVLIVIYCVYMTSLVVKWLISASATNSTSPVPYLGHFIGITFVAASVTFFLLLKAFQWFVQRIGELVKEKIDEPYRSFLPLVSPILIIATAILILPILAAFLYMIVKGGPLALATCAAYWIFVLAVGHHLRNEFGNWLQSAGAKLLARLRRIALIPTNALNRLTLYSSKLLQRIRFSYLPRESTSVIAIVAFGTLFATLAHLYFYRWTPLELPFINLLLMFGMIGIVRGFLKELGVTTVLLALLFGLSRFEDRIPAYVGKAMSVVGFAVPEAPDPTGQFIWASLYILVIVFVTLISYHGETLAFQGKSPKGPLGVLFGLMTGLLNGYLVSGSLWYFLDKYDYPIRFLGFHEPLTDFAVNLIHLLPLTVLRPFLPFLVIFLVLAQVVR